MGKSKAVEGQVSSASTADDWDWADSIDTTALGRMAQVTLELFQRPERWIHRRVECISFKDHHLVHHQVSVDFTLPAGMPSIGEFEGKGIFIAPLFLLVKDSLRPLREGKRPRRRFLVLGEGRPDPTKQVIPTATCSHFDFSDQELKRVPLITRRQSNQLASTMLLVAAESALGAPVPEALENDISNIPDGKWSDQTTFLNRLLADGFTPCDDACLYARLREDKIFPDLAWTLASHYIVACLFMGDAPRRSIYKLSYDQRANEDGPLTKGAIRRSLGWKSEQYHVPLSEIGGSASYHVAIEVPKELLINAVGLVGKHYKHYDELRGKGNRDYFIRQIESVSDGKIFIPRPLPGRRVGLVWVKLRAKRSGFLIGALATSIIISVMLWTTYLKAPAAMRSGNSEAAAAALLLAPALLAAYLLRPGEHAITAKMLQWARAALLIDAVLPGIAVFFIITGHVATHYRGTINGHLTSSGTASPGTVQVTMNLMQRASAESLSVARGVWLALAIASTVVFVLFIISNILPMPHGETIYRPKSAAGRTEDSTPEHPAVAPPP
jgi:hypothetical protein